MQKFPLTRIMNQQNKTHKIVEITLICMLTLFDAASLFYSFWEQYDRDVYQPSIVKYRADIPIYEKNFSDEKLKELNLRENKGKIFIPYESRNKLIYIDETTGELKSNIIVSVWTKPVKPKISKLFIWLTIVVSIIFALSVDVISYVLATQLIILTYRGNSDASRKRRAWLIGVSALIVWLGTVVLSIVIRWMLAIGDKGKEDNNYLELVISTIPLVVSIACIRFFLFDFDNKFESLKGEIVKIKSEIKQKKIELIELKNKVDDKYLKDQLSKVWARVTSKDLYLKQDVESIISQLEKEIFIKTKDGFNMDSPNVLKSFQSFEEFVYNEISRLRVKAEKETGNHGISEVEISTEQKNKLKEGLK
ncbi:hypothetical protein FACS1894132_05940 [Clostridia bacterium]|nr:hypothetical protein FACS1894132_05940 [Clostridia bacterium]